MELHHRESGEGAAVVCLHETAATGEIWGPLAEALGRRARTIAPDRRGWGGSEAPEPYGRTTIQEQAEDAASLLERLDAAPAVICGAGLGAVAALDLAVRRPDVARAAVLVEPPLLAFVPEATEQLSTDGLLIREAYEHGGLEAALDLYLSGALTALGPGAERLPNTVTRRARERPLTLFAELGAVPAWDLPLAAFAAHAVPTAVIVAPTTSAIVRAACEALVGRIPGAQLHELDGAPPHTDSAPELAELVLELL